MKTPSDKQIDILKKKIKYYNSFEQYGGCFTYKEILILFYYYRVKINYCNEWKIQYSRKQMKNGLNGSMWFYFLLPKNHELKWKDK